MTLSNLLLSAPNDKARFEALQSKTAFKKTNITNTYGTGSFIVIHNSSHILKQLNLVPTYALFLEHSVLLVFCFVCGIVSDRPVCTPDGHLLYQILY